MREIIVCSVRCTWQRTFCREVVIVKTGGPWLRFAREPMLLRDKRFATGFAEADLGGSAKIGM